MGEQYCLSLAKVRLGDFLWFDEMLLLRIMGKDTAYWNGAILSPDEVKISPYDHTYLYGDGIFEGIRVINKKVLLHQEHVDRLYRSADGIRVGLPSRAEYEKALFDTIKASGYSDCYLRVVVGRGSGPMGLDPTKCPKPTLMILVTTIALYPEEKYEKGISVLVVKTRKPGRETFDCGIKSCNYLNNLIGLYEALDEKFDDAVMCDPRGFVSEATVANVCSIKGNTVRSPSPSTNCLNGCTKNVVLLLAQEAGFNVEEGEYTPEEFFDADEAFITGTGAGILPITKVGPKLIGAGVMGDKTRKLRAIYDASADRFSTPIV